MTTIASNLAKPVSEIEVGEIPNEKSNLANVDKTLTTEPPAGLAMLCAVELLERLSFYGVRAILVLYMIAPVARGGLELGDAQATAIYGLWFGASYLTALFGGWLADSWFGPARAVKFGALTLLLGHGLLVWACSSADAVGQIIPVQLILGLAIIAVGTGLFKPNQVSLVGTLYKNAESRRDAGFSLFYMSVNAGALAGGVVCGWMSYHWSWLAGFGAAASGIILCNLLLFTVAARRARDLLNQRKLLRPSIPVARKLCLMTVAMLSLAIGCWWSGIGAIGIANGVTAGVAVLAVSYFAFLLAYARGTPDEARRIVTVLILVATGTVFIFGFEQSGSWLTIFAERMVQRSLFGINVPASWYSTVNAISVLILAPLLTLLWRWQTARGGSDSPTGVKLGAGLAFVAAGFFLLAYAANLAEHLGQVISAWLIGTYVLHSLGEVLISPVSLSAVSRIAPPKLTGQLIGAWYMSSALGTVASSVLTNVGLGNGATLSSRFVVTGIILGVGSMTIVLAGRQLRRLGL